MTFPLETCRANCRICTLAAIMRDCVRCPFYGKWTPPAPVIKFWKMHIVDNT